MPKAYEKFQLAFVSIAFAIDCYFPTGVYAGIEFKMNRCPRLPLADITNWNNEIKFDGLERFWRVFVKEECVFCSWNFAVINDTVVLSHQTQYCINGFLAYKIISVDRNLSYQVKVGDVICNDLANLNIPCKFSSKQNDISILSVMSGCKLEFPKISDKSKRPT